MCYKMSNMQLSRKCYRQHFNNILFIARWLNLSRLILNFHCFHFFSNIWSLQSHTVPFCAWLSPVRFSWSILGGLISKFAAFLFTDLIEKYSVFFYWTIIESEHSWYAMCKQYKSHKIIFKELMKYAHVTVEIVQCLFATMIHFVNHMK